MALETITQDTLTDLLRQDHRRMKSLFNDFERARGAEREGVVREAMDLIARHDKVEQKLLYPYARKASGVDQGLVLSCLEAHHVANILLTELKVLPYNERYFAKFSKLCSAVRDHIQEEESELFPALESSDIDLGELGTRAQSIRESWIPAIAPSAGVGMGVMLGAGLLAALAWFVYSSFVQES